MTPKQLIEYARSHGCQIVDLKFCDLLGLWQHFSIPASELEPGMFETGLGFDGSSIRGWQAIQASDMLVLPDAASAKLDPFTAVPTLSLIGDIIDPVTRANYSRDPRHIARKAAAYLRASGVADTAHFGPEAEFFVLDDVRYDQNQRSAYYYLDSVEGQWNSGREEAPNLGYKPRYKEGYFPVPPTDSLQDIRSDMVCTLEQLGLRLEAHHHEVATAGQCEIDLRYLPLEDMADAMMWYKYVVKNVARRHGKTATFMPKPVFADNGTGMHVHQSLWLGGEPLFAGDGYAGLSQLAMHYIGGILKHAPALAAFTNPSTNSYRRLVPGFEAPINLAYSSRNRSAAVRIPMYLDQPAAKRIEVRFPDPSCNPYLAFSAMLMAGLDGIEHKLDPGEPLDKDIYAMSASELAEVPSTPASLEQALSCLREDCEFLLKGEVFTDDVIDTWIDYKMEREVSALRLRPHPYEFALYFDA